MNKQANKHLNPLMILLIILSLLIPVNSFADTNEAVKVIGDPDNPKLTIFKYEDGNFKVNEHGGFKENIDGDPIEGVEFTLTQTHVFDENTDSWEEIEQGSQLVGTTDSDGKVVFTKDSGLQLGRYEIRETDAPDHVVKFEEVYAVDLPMTSEEGTSLNYDVYIYAKNEIVMGDVVLEKVNEQGEALAGVQFALFKEDGSKPFEDNVFTTDSSGIISIDNLAKGNYYFTELASAKGYASNNEKIHFEVLAIDGETKVEWIPSEGFVNEEGIVINNKIPEIEKDVEGTDHYFVDRDKEFVYNITIKTPADIHKYKTLGVTDSLDDRIQFIADGSITEGWKVSGTYRDNVEFTQNGQTLIWSIKDLSELRPNEDITITFTAKIKADADLGADIGIPNEASLDFDNDRGEFSDPKDPPTTPPVIVTPKNGGLKIIKVDKDNTNLRLQGAEFKITTDEAGENVFQTGNLNIKVNGVPFNGPLENLVSMENGEILVENLPTGTYYLLETKAPTYRDKEGNIQNYNRLTKSVKFTIDSTTEMKEMLIKNSKSKWFIPRTGGLGTILFTSIGILFIVAAVIVFFRKRKEEIKEQLTV